MPPCFDRKLNLLLCGAAGVGKRTIVQCFCSEKVNEAGEASCSFTLDEVRIDIHLSVKEKWDPSHIRDFNAVAVIFATNDVDSYEYCMDLISEIRKCGYIPIVAIENKIDRFGDGNLEKAVVEAGIRQIKTRLYRVSASQDYNIMHPFAYLLEKLTRSCDENSNVQRSPVENIRLPSREGWSEIREQQKKERCSVM